MEIRARGAGIPEQALAETRIVWDGLPFMTAGGETFSYEADRPSNGTVPLASWLKLGAYKIEARVDEEAGDLISANIPPDDNVLVPEVGKDVVFTYTHQNLIETYRHEIGAHQGGKQSGNEKRRVHHKVITEGPWAFRTYTRGLMLGLAQDLLLGLFTTRRKTERLQKVLGRKLDVCNIGFKAGTALGYPGPRWEGVPRQFIVRGTG